MRLKKRDLLKAFFTAGAVLFFWLHVIPHLRYSFTDSAGAHLFWIKSGCSFTRWELVEVRVDPHDPFVPDPQHTLLIKHIACLPGERVTRRGLSFYCNGHIFLGRAKKRARDGRPLRVWVPDVDVIPPGMYFLSNPACPDSYDSRYLGLFKRSSIVHCLEPLF